MDVQHAAVGPRGGGGIDDAFVRLFDTGIGAEIMGAGKFGHPGWHEDPDWKGAWGPNPPFHTPVFVLTHHTRPSIEMEGGTTYHFVDASPAEALEQAREAAGGQDVRLGGGPTLIREFLAAGLVDHMHVVVVPILLGRGVPLWTGLEGLEQDYAVEATSSPSGVTHVTFTRAAAESLLVDLARDRRVDDPPRRAQGRGGLGGARRVPGRRRREGRGASAWRSSAAVRAAWRRPTSWPAASTSTSSRRARGSAATAIRG